MNKMIVLIAIIAIFLEMIAKMRNYTLEWAIKEDMSDCLFSILVDESRDILVKEQMAIIIKYISNFIPYVSFDQLYHYKVYNLTIVRFLGMMDSIIGVLGIVWLLTWSHFIWMEEIISLKIIFIIMFDVNKLASLTEIYLEDFSFDDRKVDEFKACHDLASLAKTMVEIDRDTIFPL
ncbi:hypothetical protein ACJX0J_034940, partial [Zea mays]